MKTIINILRIFVVLLYIVYIGALIAGSDFANKTLLVAAWLLACSNFIELQER